MELPSTEITGIKAVPGAVLGGIVERIGDILNGAFDRLTGGSGNSR
jgi:hypothetical protein